MILQVSPGGYLLHCMITIEYLQRISTARRIETQLAILCFQTATNLALKPMWFLLAEVDSILNYSVLYNGYIQQMSNAWQVSKRCEFTSWASSDLLLTQHHI